MIAKPRLTLRQLVRRSRGVPFYRGRVHIWERTADRALCGRSFRAGYWADRNGFGNGLEYPEHPFADCVKCLDNFRQWQAQLAGIELVIDERETVQVLVRRVTVSRPGAPAAGPPGTP